MAGEMHRSDVTRDAFPLYFAVTDEFGGTVEPFDVYQGPYIDLGPHSPGGKGYTAFRRALWIDCPDGGMCRWYDEANDRFSSWFSQCDELGAVLAAGELLN